MKEINFGILTLLLLLPPALMAQTGEVIEQAAMGAAFAVACGFVAGEAAWVIAPEFPDEEDPYRVALPAALAGAYGVGVPFGSALGVHLSGLVMDKNSPLWPKWAGAEIAALAAGGICYLITSNTEEVLPLAFAYSFPVVAGIGGAFAGEAISHKLGWTDASLPIKIGLYPAGDELAVWCGIRFNF